MEPLNVQQHQTLLAARQGARTTAELAQRLGIADGRAELRLHNMWDSGYVDSSDGGEHFTLTLAGRDATDRVGDSLIDDVEVLDALDRCGMGVHTAHEVLGRLEGAPGIDWVEWQLGWLSDEGFVIITPRAEELLWYAISETGRTHHGHEWQKVERP